jgi:molybdopterin converting factor subunit 1
MLITVRFFASYADALGRKDAQLSLNGEACVEDLLKSVSELPGASALPPNPLVAVNQIYAGAATRLKAGDEVALIPPVAGG